MLDLDHFKSINDVYGHAEGDKVLKEVAARLRASVRGGDTVARLGGEEFALILPGVDGDGAAEAAERARAAIADVEVAGAALTCSAGVAAFPEDAQEAARLLELADGALYLAKRSGRDQARRYDQRLAGQLSGDGQRAEIEALLEREDAIVPVFQPVLELATGRVAGYEALARMPEGPFRPPDQWFNQAHRVGLGAALEAAALRAALDARGRPERTFLALNVCPGALVSREVRAVLPQDLTGIVIELTEHELFSADPTLDREIDALRARGARIALDDAGNGYAGLQQIIRVAPDILKLDRSLVDGIHEDPHRFALLEALISFASTTRAAVCAEGVETLEDLAVLSGMDVTYAQGWALARPEAPWAALAPDAAAAATAEVRIGLRVPRESPADGAPTLGDLISRLTRVRRDGRPRGVRGDDPGGARGRGRGGLARRARRALRRGHQPPRLVAARRPLSPRRVPRDGVGAADAHRGPGRGRRPGLRSLRGRPDRGERLRRGAHGPARLRRPRRRPARALPPPRAAVEQRGDRARAAARAPARGGHRPARAGQPGARAEPVATLRIAMAILVDELREYPAPGSRSGRGATWPRTAAGRSCTPSQTGSGCGGRGSRATTTTCRRTAGGRGGAGRRGGRDGELLLRMAGRAGSGRGGGAGALGRGLAAGRGGPAVLRYPAGALVASAGRPGRGSRRSRRAPAAARAGARPRRRPGARGRGVGRRAADLARRRWRRRWPRSGAVAVTTALREGHRLALTGAAAAAGVEAHLVLVDAGAEECRAGRAAQGGERIGDGLFEHLLREWSALRRRSKTAPLQGISPPSWSPTAAAAARLRRIALSPSS